jgi:hypothetical protein
MTIRSRPANAAFSWEILRGNNPAAVLARSPASENRAALNGCEYRGRISKREKAAADGPQPALVQPFHAAAQASLIDF